MCLLMRIKDCEEHSDLNMFDVFHSLAVELKLCSAPLSGLWPDNCLSAILNVVDRCSWYLFALLIIICFITIPESYDLLDHPCVFLPLRLSTFKCHLTHVFY